MAEGILVQETFLNCVLFISSFLGTDFSFAFLKELFHSPSTTIKARLKKIIKNTKGPLFFAWSNETLLISSTLLLLMASPCDATVWHKETKQKLSKECWDMLQYDLYNTCPDQEHVFALDLQELCCNSSNSLKFHCQHYEVNGIDILLPACLPEETCKPGFSCRIAQGSDGSPHIIQEPCENGLFASENRSSVSQVYPYCTDSHTQCTNVEQTEFCQGDNISDTRCRCNDGYSSQDRTGCDKMKAFTQHSTCSCIPSDKNITYCPVWKHSLCSQLSPEQFLINRTNCPEQNDPPTKVTVNSTAFVTTEQLVTTTAHQTENDELATIPPWLIAVITVALLMAAVVPVIICRAKKAVYGRLGGNICAPAPYGRPPDQPYV